jgi:hypothetical protein
MIELQLMGMILLFAIITIFILNKIPDNQL